MVSAPANMPALRAWVARLEGRVGMGVLGEGALGFGVDAIDVALPGGGLVRGALHEVSGGDNEAAPGVEAALAFVAGIAARASGPVLWVAPRVELYAPGLAMAGLDPALLLVAEAGGDKQVLAAMEEGLRHKGLKAVVGEVDAASLTVSRRLQLAAQAGGALGLLLCRRAGSAPSAAVTRWRVAGVPGPGRSRGQEAPGLSDMGRAHWRLDLVRCRGGEPKSWIVEACDGQGRLDLVAPMGDRSTTPVEAAFGRYRRG